MATDVLPTPVGPQIIIIFGFSEASFITNKWGGILWQDTQERNKNQSATTRSLNFNLWFFNRKDKNNHENTKEGKHEGLSFLEIFIFGLL
jgi:hypothetical protein